MLKYIIISCLIILIAIGGIASSGITANKQAVGFLMDNNSFSNLINQILRANKLNQYLNYLRVSNLQIAVNSLPPNSVLARATATLGNQHVNDPWTIITNQNNRNILTFSTITTNFDFRDPRVNANVYIAAINWDPNLTGQVAWGISYSRNIYKVYKNGDNRVVEQKYTGNESGGIVATIGDFNNDGKADFFVIKNNEDNNAPTRAQEAAVFVQGNNETFSKQTININSWNQDQTKVDLKCTAGSATAQYQKWDDENKRYIIDKFDYNNDGKQDILIASADGCIYVLENTTTNNTISFSDPIKLVNTGIKTGQYDGTYNGAQVLSLGDINKDGIPDLVVASTDSSQLYIFYGKLDNQGKLYFGNNPNNPHNQSNPDVKLYDTEINGNNKIVKRESAVESSEYKGPGTQTRENGNPPPPPESEYTGGATNVILADVNKDGELDILLATDGWQFRPNKIKNGNNVQDFDLKIKHTNENKITNSPGGRIFYMIRTQQGKYKNYFLGQYALTGQSDADFDNATIVNFSGPDKIDFVATDGNHAQKFFTFEATGSLYINADKFIIESKDLVKKAGSSSNSFDFNTTSFYIKTIRLRIIANLNNIPLKISLANRISIDKPLYVDIPPEKIPSNTTINDPLIVEVDFYPQDSDYVRYRINNDEPQTTPIRKMRGNSIYYKLTFDTKNLRRETIESITGQRVEGLARAPKIHEIYVEYEAAQQSLKIKNWKEVR